MPLHIEHSRDGETIPYRWGGWHLTVFFEVTSPKKDFAVELSPSRWQVTTEATFVDPSDGEELTIQVGDLVTMSR